jgi:hypothetical protein
VAAEELQQCEVDLDAEAREDDELRLVSTLVITQLINQLITQQCGGPCLVCWPRICSLAHFNVRRWEHVPASALVPGGGGGAWLGPQPGLKLA